MMRRSRISVRPNVRPGARALTSQHGQSSLDAVDTTQETKREGIQPVTTETTQAADKPADSLQSSENITPYVKEMGLQNFGGGDTTASMLQRRKRFSAMPNLAKPRVPIASSRAAVRIPKSPPPNAPNLPPAETVALTPKENGTSQGVRSPRWRRASGGGKPSRIQGKPAPLPPSVPASGKQEPLSLPAPAPGPVSQRRRGKETSAPLQCTKSSDLEKTSQQGIPLPDPAPVSAMQLQSARLEVKTPSLPPVAQSMPLDKERIARLRELIKQEQRKQRKRKLGIPQDHNKMTMRDLIYYLPDSNPMKSYPVEENRPVENPPSPNKELPETPPALPEEDEERVHETDHEGDEPTEEDQLVVPRVKVAEDGTLILDEESLTVEVLRTKGPNLAEENDPIFERGSSTTYSSFRKTVYTKPWSNKETELFFVAISMVGTDLSLIAQLFPRRARTEIKNMHKDEVACLFAVDDCCAEHTARFDKNKFKKEERENSWRIDKAFQEKRRFDLEFFSKHLEKALAEEERKRKKSKTKVSVGEKKKTSISKGKKAAAQRAPSEQSSAEELDSDVVEGDSETAEKENEDCTNVVEAGANATAAKNSHKRKSREEEDAPHEKSAEGRSLKRSRAEGSADESALSEDCEASVCDVQPAAPDVDGLKKPESCIRSREGPEIKPAQLSRGRFQRPAPNLGARWAKKAPQPGGKTTDGDVENTSSKGDGQERNWNKPTRREQKPAHMEDLDEESSSASSSHPKGVVSKGQGKQPAGPGRRAKPRPNLAAAQKNGRAGKPKLVTLRASLPEDNEEEEQDEIHPEEEFHYPINPEEQNQAPAFVPLSLRSPQPVSMEVVETMEELEISMNVSDVLGTAESEHALCPQPLCPGAQDEVMVSTEHQLDLLVDVIEFLSPDHVAGSEESYNEAARTLLTIRNPELLSLAAPAYSREVIITEESSHVLLDETEPRECLPSESADQLQYTTEQPEMLSYVTETSQSATQSTHDMVTLSLTPVEEFESDSVRSEAVLMTQSYETSILEHTSVPEESLSQRRAVPVPEESLSQARTVPVLEESLTQRIGVPIPEESLSQMRTVPVPEESLSQQRAVPVPEESVSQQRAVPEKSLSEERAVPVPEESLSQWRAVHVPEESLSQERAVPVTEKSLSEARAVPLPEESLSHRRAVPVPEESLSQQRAVPVLEESLTQRIGLPVPEESLNQERDAPVPEDSLSQRRAVPVPDVSLSQQRAVPVPEESLSLQRAVPDKSLSQQRAVPVPEASLRQQRAVSVPEESLSQQRAVPVPVESLSQERDAPASTGEIHDGTLCPKPSVQNVLPGRRSRFPKPKPNLVRTARTPRAIPAQCIEKSAVAPVEPEALKTVEVEKSAMSSSPKEQCHESQASKGSGEAMLGQDPAPRVGDSQGEGSGSDLPKRSVPSAGRARQLPKPVLDRDVRGPCVTPPLSTPVAPNTEDDQRRPSGATKANKLTEEGTFAGSANGMRAEMVKKEGYTSAEGRRTEDQAEIPNSLAEVEEANGASSIVTVKEQCLEDGGEKINETAVCIDTVQEATSLHMDGDLSAAVSCEATDGQQPTFILTLFEVPPPLLGELDSGVDPPGTITAELLSPLVFVDEQLAPPATRTETRSCDPLNVVASVEMYAEPGLMSHPMARASKEQEEHSGRSSIWERRESTTGVTSNCMTSPVDLCESISLTLAPSEESHCKETGGKQSSPLLKKRKMAVGSEKGHRQLKPNSSTPNIEDQIEDGQTVFRGEHLRPITYRGTPQAQLHPAAQHTSTEPPAKPGPSATEDPPRGSVGCCDLPELDGESTSSVEGTESSSAGTGPQTSQQALPVASSGLVTRTGRKPRGFLSFISDKSTTRPAGALRSARPTCPRPQVNTSRPGRRTASTSTAPSSARAANSQAAAISQTATKFTASQASASTQEKSSSVKTSKTDEEPTSVSEYFFSDIFTQVEEPE